MLGICHSGAHGRDLVECLNDRYGAAKPETVLNATITAFWPSIAVLSSFGADSAALLHLVARIDRAVPVLFLETGKHFEETLHYRQHLVKRLRLTDVRTIEPDVARLMERDPTGTLHRTDPDFCCRLRKVEPLAKAIQGFAALVTGRKRYQGGARQDLRPFEWNGRVKVNPLVGWSRDQVMEHLRAHDLPLHPLLAQGYASIGCACCTRAVAPGDALRSGRWVGFEKTECGIHAALSR